MPTDTYKSLELDLDHQYLKPVGIVTAASFAPSAAAACCLVKQYALSGPGASLGQRGKPLIVSLIGYAANGTADSKWLIDLT